MSMFSVFTRGAARHRRGEPDQSPVAPVSTVAQPTEPQAATKAHDPSESFEMTIYEQAILRSPLALATTPAAADTLDVIYRDDSVQRAAGACAAKLQRLAEMAGFTSQIHFAIEAVAREGTDLSPGAVAEALRRRAEDIEDALSDIREDRAVHQAASLKRMARHEPLLAAARGLLNQLVAERDCLIREDESAARAAAMGLPTRYSILISAGLTPAQIEATEPAALSPEVLIQTRRARLADVVPQIQKLRDFATSTTFDASAIAGIDPAVDAAIVARDGALPVEVA